MTERPSPQFIQMSPLDQSALAGMATRDHGQYLRITKLALRQYLHECVAEDGQFRQFFNRFASNTIEYHTDDSLADDYQTRYLQIAAYYSGVSARAPHIFIQDNGFPYVPDGLGCVSAGWNMHTRDGNQTVRVMEVVRIPIELHLAAMSVTEIDDLINFVNLAFGRMQHLTTGYVLRPATQQGGAYWEVRIPFPHNVSAKSSQPLHGGDPRDQLWQATISMEVEFENSSFMQYRAQPQFEPRRGDLTLTVPNYLRINQEQHIMLQNRPNDVSVYSDDARIAVVEKRGREWIIRPRRVGKFNLLVTRIAGGNKGPEILAQQEIEVRAR